jgi:hypothetical protein
MQGCSESTPRARQRPLGAGALGGIGVARGTQAQATRPWLIGPDFGRTGRADEIRHARAAFG